MEVWLFNWEHTAGKLFTDANEFERAIQKGEWWDAQWKVGREPALKDKCNLEKNNEKVEIFEPKISKKYCACGCGQEVTAKWVKGHQFRGVKKNGNYQNHQPPD